MQHIPVMGHNCYFFFLSIVLSKPTPQNHKTPKGISYILQFSTYYPNMSKGTTVTTILMTALAVIWAFFQTRVLVWLDSVLLDRSDQCRRVLYFH